MSVHFKSLKDFLQQSKSYSFQNQKKILRSNSPFSQKSDDVIFIGNSSDFDHSNVIDLTKPSKKIRKYNFATKKTEKSVISNKKCKKSTDCEIIEIFIKISFKKRQSQIKNFFKKRKNLSQISAKIPLFDPITLLRLKEPARGKNCVHFSSFELCTFLSQLTNGRKSSKCPLCDLQLTRDSIVLDGYLNKIIKSTTKTTAKFVTIQSNGDWEISQENRFDDKMTHFIKID